MKKLSRLFTVILAVVLMLTMVSASTSTSATTAIGTTWFSQGSSSAGTGWTSTKLNYLYFSNMAECSDYCGGSSLMKCANTPFYTTSSFSASSNQLNKGHMNKWGCSICSLAMILRNMGATTTSSRYDFRTGTTGYLTADPFTVTMANIGWPTVTTSSSTRYEITSYTSSKSPVYIYWATAAGSFGKSATMVSLSGYTAAEKADIIATYVNNHPEGIIVRVAGAHTVVFTATTHSISSTSAISVEEVAVTEENEALIAFEEMIASENSLMTASVSSTSYDSEFTCYDPGTSTSSKGNGVAYSSSYCASTYGGIDQVTYIYYFN